MLFFSSHILFSLLNIHLQLDYYDWYQTENHDDDDEQSTTPGRHITAKLTTTTTEQQMVQEMDTGLYGKERKKGPNDNVSWAVSIFSFLFPY